MTRGMQCCVSFSFYPKRKGMLCLANRKTIIIGLAVFFLFTFNIQQNIEASDFEPIGPGVEYKKDDLLYGGNPQSTRIMKIEADENTRFHLGYTGPRSLHRITAYGNDSRFSNRMIGGMNGSFFNLPLENDHSNMVRPNYLIAKDNDILHLGSMSSSDTGIMSVPAAFGIDEDGNPMIGTFELDIIAETSSGSVEIDRINTSRGSGEVILYAPGQRRTATPTNEFGREFTVVDSNQLINHDLSFGDTISGEISNLKNYGTRNASPIPGDGFIISGHGTTLNSLLEDVGNGDSVSLTIDIEGKWKDAELMLASGPLLVQGGEVDITMAPGGTSYYATNPRSGIGIDEQGNVFFVTVDGRQGAYSQGMTLPQFASYMKELGAVEALNLDGGGSTAMVKRDFKNNQLTLANSPSDHWERAVSTSLFIENTAPEGTPSRLGLSKVQYYATVDEEVTIEADYILDENFNVLNPDEHQKNLSGDESLDFDGSVVSGSVPGTYDIEVTSGIARDQVTFTVLDEKVHYSDGLEAGNTSAVRASATSSLKEESVKGEQMTTIHKQYEMNQDESGTAAAYWNFDSLPEIKGQPDSVGLWVYGEGQGHWLRGTIEAPDGSQQVIDFTERGELNWHGWKYIKADIPDLAAGSELTRIYVVETEEEHKKAARISYAGLTLHYDDYEADYIGSNEEGDVYAGDKEWTVEFSVPVSPADAKDRVYVEDEAGNRSNVIVERGDSKTELSIRPADGEYSEGRYRLVVARSKVSKQGTPLGDESEILFEIQ